MALKIGFIGAGRMGKCHMWLLKKLKEEEKKYRSSIKKN